MYRLAKPFTLSSPCANDGEAVGTGGAGGQNKPAVCGDRGRRAEARRRATTDDAKPPSRGRSPRSDDPPEDDQTQTATAPRERAFEGAKRPPEAKRGEQPEGFLRSEAKQKGTHFETKTEACRHTTRGVQVLQAFSFCLLVLLSDLYNSDRSVLPCG